MTTHEPFWTAMALTTSRVFGAYLRTIRWQTASAADRKLAGRRRFRAGIRLDRLSAPALRAGRCELAARQSC